MLSRQVWDDAVAHARVAYPAEAVGLLGGIADGRVTHLAPLPNLGRIGSFVADPRAQFEAERALDRLRLVPLGTYHSHPDGTPTLSRADRALARRSLVQLVIALDGGDRVEARAYRVAADVRELVVRIDGRRRSTTCWTRHAGGSTGSNRRRRTRRRETAH